MIKKKYDVAGRKRLHLKAMLYLLAGMLFFSGGAKSQVSSYYIYSQSQQAYTGGISTLTTPASIFLTAWDDASYSLYKFPFTFTYNGVLYPGGTATIGVDTDGWAAFSPTGSITMTGPVAGGSWVSGSDHTGVYLNGIANNNGFCAFNSDLTEQTWATITGNTTAGSAIVNALSDITNLRIGTRLTGSGITDGTVINSINTVANSFTMSTTATITGTTVTITPRSSIYAFTRGTAPYRQFVIQWTRVTRFPTPGDDFSFQLVLNEGGGDPVYQTLQAVYGTCKATNTVAQNAQVGLRGASNADFNARKTTTNWAATSAATLNTDVCALTPAVDPPTGLTFTWSPACLGPAGNAGAMTGATSVCPNTIVDYEIPGVPGAIFYNWTYTGGGTTLSGTTTLPLNSLNFGTLATGGTLTVTPGNLCGNGTASSVVIAINAAPTATISYPSASYCTNAAPVSVTQTGTVGGTYSVSPAGLTISSSTGQLTPASSTAGNYIVTYTFVSGCTATTTASVTINATPVATATATPSSVCSGVNSQLSVAASGGIYSVTSISHTTVAPSGAPVNIFNTYTDDGIFPTTTLPIPFNYYGVAVTQFSVSSNGYIQLGAGVSALTAQTLPNATTPNSVIALAWNDLVVDPTVNAGANVRYFVNGTTPNRVFVVDFVGLSFFSFPTNIGNMTGQIRLYENDSHIEVAATTVNDAGKLSKKTLGIENSTGTVGLTPAGRNNVVWNLGASEAWSFSPTTFTYLWSPATFLSSTTISNPVASSVTATTAYSVQVTNTATGCSGTGTTTLTYATGLSGTYTVGAAGNYPTLTAAVNAYNTVCITGPVTFSLIDATYSAGETFPININSNVYASATNTLTIKPAVGINPTITGASAVALIKLNGADYITIDGSNVVSGTTRNLSLINTSTNATTSTIIWINSASTSNGATNNNIRNCIITGNAPTTTFTSIISSSGATVGAVAEAANNNNTYVNNLLTKCQTAIAVVGPTGNETGTVISGNTIGSATPANKLGWSGIEVYQQANCIVRGNIVFGITTATTITTSGISVFGTASGITISNNKISDIKNTNTIGFGCNGIYLGSLSTTANVSVVNNFISDIAAYGYTGDAESDNGYGIIIDGGAGYDISFNTVVLNTSQTATGFPAALTITSNTTTVPSVSIRNNILVNTQSQPGEHYTIQCSVAKNKIGAINYNDYYSPGGNLGFLAVNLPALTDIVTAFGGNANSKNVQPVFNSNIDFHLITNLNTALSNAGLTITGVTTDIDGDTRTGTPDIGADEFTATTLPPLCGIYHIGTAQAKPFNSLTNAVAALNLYGVSCAVTFLLDDALYSTEEAFPVNVLKFTGSSSVNTFTIKPNAATTNTITGAVANIALIKILSSYTSIDGSNTAGGITRDLTITNTSATAPSVLHVGSLATVPITQSNIINCNIINGSVGSSAVVVSDGMAIGAAGYFNNIGIQNNNIQKAYMGIYNNAVVAAGNGNGLTIASNLINTSGANAVSTIGIYLQGVDRGSVRDNNIGNFETATAEIDRGIWLATGSSNCNIQRNVVHDLRYTGTGGYGAKGIVISSGLAASNDSLINNMIYNITGDGESYTTYGALRSPVGIYAFGVGQGGIHMYFNSIYLYGNTLNKTNAASFGIALDDNTIATSKNNMILNNLGLLSATGIGAIAIAAKTSTAQFVAGGLNFNNYFCSATGSGINAIGRINATNYLTLPTWQAAVTPQEIVSQNILPVFVSATDLHMNAASPGNATLTDAGTAIAGLTVDYDITTRNGLTPDIGADEWLRPNTGSWVGKTSIDWLVPSNWETNTIPGATTDVVVSGGYTFMPTVVTTQAVRNLTLKSNTPTLTINGGILQIYGTITRSAGNINGANGTVEMNGTTAQNIPALLFQGNNLKNLVIGNSNNLTGVTIQGTLDIYRSLTFSGTGLKLTTGNFLTFKSTATETAWLGNVTGKTIVGSATVERYIPTGLNHGKSWQLLSVPVRGTQSIKASWQENNLPLAVGTAGLGTTISSEKANATTRGFDFYTPAGPSMKTYNPVTNTYVGVDDGVTNTSALSIANQRGYLLLVRGDRSVQTSAAAANPTTLRTFGGLFTATTGETPATTTVLANKFETIGNPYASAIDFTLLTRAAGVDNLFYLWDPLLPGGSGYGLGGYQTISSVTGFLPTPGSLNYPPATPVTRIQSGQAFYVHGTAGGTVGFSEAAKVTGSSLVLRPAAQQNRQFLRLNLYDPAVVNFGAVDGNVVAFDKNFNNGFDPKDALKISNTNENIGIWSNDTSMAIEARKPVSKNDTIFYKMASLRQQPYQFRFGPENMAGYNLSAWLVDRYLQSMTPVSLSDSTFIDFAITADAASATSNRFYLVFKKLEIVPLRITHIAATRNNDKSILVDWKVENEADVDNYDIERSNDGRNFSLLNNMPPKTNTGIAGLYKYTDEKASLSNDQFYRIKAMSRSGENDYSAIVKVGAENADASISVYPNPLVNKILTVSFLNQQEGIYHINLRNKLGQLVLDKTIQVKTNNTTESIQLSNTVAAGNYQLTIVTASGKRTTQQVIVN